MQEAKRDKQKVAKSSKKSSQQSQVSKEPMIVVDNVSMSFNIANEQLNNLKEYFIALMRGKLFFKEFKALENINFTVRKGDVYGIVGTNGSGKSTLLKLISGVLEPTQGSCKVYGSIAPLIELGAGFDLDLTARENIYLNGALLGYSKKFIDQHFEDIVEFADVGNFIDMPLKNYSSGMVARIAFAIATATTPDILVVDEALSVGDFMFQDKCERRINDLVENHGTTLLFVSHSIDQVERVCKRALWIEKGHMRMEGTVKDVCFAYRNMGSTEFVENNKIMKLKSATAAELKQPVTTSQVITALWRSVGAPEQQSADDESQAFEWALGIGLLKELDRADYHKVTTRQELACCIYRFSRWRKPGLTYKGKLKAELYCDALPKDKEAYCAVAWCITTKIMSAIKNKDGSAALSLNKPATYVVLAQVIAELYTKVFSYPRDVELQDWYVLPGYYDYAVEHKLISGYADGNFGPHDAITRAQAVVIFWRCAGEPEVKEKHPFTDVSREAYYLPALNWAYSANLLDNLTSRNKSSDTLLFKGRDTISFEEMAIFVLNYIRYAQTDKAQAAKAAARKKLDTTAAASQTQTSECLLKKIDLSQASDPLAWCREYGMLEEEEQFVTDDSEKAGAKNRKLRPDVTRASMVKVVAIIERDILPTLRAQS